MKKNIEGIYEGWWWIEWRIGIVKKQRMIGMINMVNGKYGKWDDEEMDNREGEGVDV